MTSFSIYGSPNYFTSYSINRKCQNLFNVFSELSDVIYVICLGTCCADFILLIVIEIISFECSKESWHNDVHIRYVWKTLYGCV